MAVGLRLGAPLCRPHQCHHCGTEVDCLATHGLSCRWSEGRHHRYAAINDNVHSSLTSAKIPARFEPSGLYRSYGKHPDGISVVPWKSGKLLVWDATCPDTFAPSYSSRATNEAGAVATQAEDRKEVKYTHLNSAHAFIPVAIETSGVFGVKTMRFVQELGQQLERVTGEVRSTNFLIQRLSVAVYTTWKLRIGAEHNGPFREFRLVLLFLRILCILICMRFNQRLNQVNERSESGLLWGRMRSGAGCTCIRGLLCACAGSSILSEQERKSCRGIRIQWHTKKRSNSGDILEFCHSLAALFFEPV